MEPVHARCSCNAPPVLLRKHSRIGWSVHRATSANDLTEARQGDGQYRGPARPDCARDDCFVIRLVFTLLIAVAAASAAGSPATARDAQAVVNVMLSELGMARPSGCPGRWCACYLDTVLARTGLVPRGSNKARDFANYGAAAAPGAIGSIMVMNHHVGVVVGNCENGQVQIVSGNYSNTVALGCYSPNRAIAWRAPVTH